MRMQPIGVVATIVLSTLAAAVIGQTNTNRQRLTLRYTQPGRTYTLEAPEAQTR